MHHPDCGDPAATGQSRRGRVVFQHALEHGLRPARHGELVGQDHNWRRGRVHVDCVDAWFADLQWLALGVVERPRERTCGEPESDTGATIRTGPTVRANATVRARDITRSPGSIASGQSVVKKPVEQSRHQSRLRLGMFVR